MGRVAVTSYHPDFELLLDGLQLHGQLISKLQREIKKKNPAGATKSPATAPIAKRRNAEGGDFNSSFRKVLKSVCLCSAVCEFLSR